MDEYEGILRVALSTREVRYCLNGAGTRAALSQAEENSSLYLVSLDDFSILSSAVKFAPEGETVQSARFDKALAYICTAKVVTFTDPVYRFDLSDPEHISSMDTGVIDGYSTSLIELENGDLFGIGYGNGRLTLKLEIYRKGETGLVSVDSFEFDGCEFSEDYKSYFIDREAGLFGVPIYTYYETDHGVTYYDSVMRYLLFSYDGESLALMMNLKLYDYPGLRVTRGFVYEGNLYVLSSGSLTVAPISCGN